MQTPKESRRVMIINQIIQTLIKITQEGLTLDVDKLIIEICAEHGCSERTAKEYYKVAVEKYNQLKAF